MKKCEKCGRLATIIGIAAAVVAIAVAVVVYWDSIAALFETIREKLCTRKNKILHADEYSDYADV